MFAYLTDPAFSLALLFSQPLRILLVNSQKNKLPVPLSSLALVLFSIGELVTLSSVALVLFLLAGLVPVGQSY